MQCNQCGSVLPTGAPFCPNCGQPVSMGRTNAVPPTELANPVAPTVMAPTENANPVAPTVIAPIENVHPIAPTMMAPTEAAPLTPNQGAYTPPPPPPGYGQATPPPPPYAPTTPPAPVSYGQVTPAPLGYAQTPLPPPVQAGPYGQPVMAPVMMPPQKKSGLTATLIVVIVLLLVCVCGATVFAGGLFIRGQQSNARATAGADDATSTAFSANEDATSTAYSNSLTPTPYPPYTESNPPSGANFSEQAQQIISNAQLADNVDSQHRPTSLESAFNSGQTIYLVYKWTQGFTGYVQTRWYFNGSLTNTTTSDYINQNDAGYGYFTNNFDASNGAVGQGAVEVFWCQDSGCTHGGLAWVRPFSVNP